MTKFRPKILRQLTRSLAGAAAVACALIAADARSETNVGGWVRYQNFKVRLPVPEGWRVERDLYGMPITVLGPERDGAERAILNLQHTSVKNLQFDYSVIQKTQNDYYQGRASWLEALPEAKFLNRIPFRKLSNAAGLEGYELGVTYRMRGLEFEERSVEVNCGGRLFFLKTLTNSKQPQSDRDTLKKLVEGLECRAVTRADGPEAPSPLRNLDKKVAEREAREWPSADQLKKAPINAKALMLEAIVEFQKDFEEAHGNDAYASAAGSSFREAMNRLLESASDLAVARAYADGAFDCFYAGWPSRFVPKGSGVTCASPADTNPSYPTDVCPSGQLACNPALFGPGICVSTASRDERAHATLRCETKFRESGKAYADVVKENGFDQNLLSGTIQAAKSVCTTQPYLSQNFGLCSTLKNKLHLSLETSGQPGDETDQQFVNGIEGLKPENYDGDVDETLKRYAQFEKECFTAAGELNEEREGCVEGMELWSQDFDRLEKFHNAIGEELDGIANSENTGKTPDCPTGDCKPPEQTAVDAGGSCSAAELKEIEAGQCRWSNVGWWLKTGTGCGWNLVTSVMKSLWSAVKGVGELVVMGVKWVGKKVSQGFSWLKRKLGFENSSAEKAHQAAQTSNGLIDEFKRDPIGAATSLVKSIASAVEDYLKNDVFCQAWTGVPHFSTCTQPANFKCLSCTAAFKGGCSVLGYVIGEFVPAILTGGATVGLKAAGVAGKVGSLLSKAGKAGKLTTMTEKLVTKFPKFSRATLGNKTANKIWQAAGKTGRIPRWWGAKKIKTVRLAYQASKSKLTAFRSLFWKTDFKQTAARLRALRVKYANRGPVKKALRGAGRLVTLPVRLPYIAAKTTGKLYKGGVYRASNTGFNWGKKIANRATADAAVKSMQISRATKRTALFVSAAKYPPRLEKLGEKTVRRIETGGYSDSEIQRMAQEQNRKPDEIRAELVQQRENVFVQTDINQRIIEGKDTEQDVTEFARIQGISVDDARNSFLLAKIDEAAMGGHPKFTTADFEAWAKANGTSPKTAEKDIQKAIEERRAQIEEATQLNQAAMNGTVEDEPPTTDAGLE